MTSPTPVVPLTAARFGGAVIEPVPFTTSDGVELGLCRIGGHSGGPAVLLIHGLTVSSEMFALSETRNLVDSLLDAGYEPWLLDWRGSRALPYNEGRVRYTFDDVALYDIPEAVSYVRGRIGDRKLFVVSHCVGAMSLGMSMAAGLVPGLAGVVAHSVFLTPKLEPKARLRVHLGCELLRSRFTRIPVDIRQAGLRSRYTPIFALASLRADCPDPTCQMLHNSAWGTGASLFEHEKLAKRTHDRLAELFGPMPTWTLPHLRRSELAHAVVRWNTRDHRYDRLPENALDSADRIDTPILLLSGSENKLWRDSNRLCHEILARRQPRLDVRYTEIPGYGHMDAFLGRGAALDVFGRIIDFLDEH
ncbi:alpha/beta hydrolase [Amycolatopsis sp. cg5]|uniref:alpha/beta hydrolase n=1 Tax=Amycolatopsis sp. cg5 TaxID=3238802 RepID=UPI00352430C1